KKRPNPGSVINTTGSTFLCNKNIKILIAYIICFPYIPSFSSSSFLSFSLSLSLSLLSLSLSPSLGNTTTLKLVSFSRPKPRFDTNPNPVNQRLRFDLGDCRVPSPISGLSSFNGV
ncbi:LOW QUALITY PROTEIN: hypothetical protein TorRG33x02_098910, partial [Trema orientale]